MIWQETYPCLAAVQQANFETLDQWFHRLPAPQTDVEKTVRRRIGLQRSKQGMRELEQTAPELHKGYVDLIAKVREVCGKAVAS